MLNIPYIVKNADALWYNIRWSETDGIPTCKCGCNDIYRLGDGRYKCKKCGKVFSDTTGTLLHHSRLSKEVWLMGIFKFAALKECSANDLRLECGVNYKTAYLMLQKLRYLAGKGEITLSGCVRMDEAYIGAEWNNVHFKKKFTYMRENGFLDPDTNRYNRNQLLRAVSAKKSHILSLTDDSDKTMLIHVPNPVTKAIIKSIVLDKKHNITKLITDESSLYKGLDIEVEQSNHSERKFMTESGVTSNIAETNFSWVKRKWNGVFTHTSDKYLQLYLNQRQFHFNHKNKSVEECFTDMLNLAVSNTVRVSDIINYDYTKAFPESRRKKEERTAKELLEQYNFPFVTGVIDKYGRTYTK